MNLKPMALIGFAGSGKTVVGSYAARELGLPFTDLTEYLPEIKDGTDMTNLNSLLTLFMSRAAVTGGIVASDGSDVMMPKNRKMLKSNFVTVFLDAPFDVLYRRITTSGKNIAYNYHESELRTMYELRKNQYLECADYTVDCSKSIEEVTSEIAEIAFNEGCADVNYIVL